ncbi:transcriptional regulator family: Fungal Specific TF [Penicillium atrosanguineum]|nr:transcriptional regulator family: Fungal Specific TF [Penicillium atrosanguineum]
MLFSDPCRLLHHKCDGDLPQCSRCARTGRACIRGQRKTRFRQVKDSGSRIRFPRNQVWLKPPPRVDFVLESGSGDDGLVAESTDDRQLDGSLPLLEKDGSLMTNPLSPQSAPQEEYLPSRDQSEGNQSERYYPLGKRRDAHTRQRLWPLRDPEEAALLKHFVDRISSFFDCTDRQQHFAVHIPFRARYCDTLFNAIMAMSARHLSRTATFDPYISDHYYQICLETLIPALNDHGAAMNDDLLAATVILRLLEEYDVPLAGSDLRGHSFGTKAFMKAPPPSVTKTPSLRQAVYWSGLPFANPPDIDLSSLHSLFTALGPDAVDCDWANQAIAHCADVLLFSFGACPRSVAVHADLCKRNEQWSEIRPASFDPYFVGDEVQIGATFPDIRFSSAWHAIGYQYNKLAKILLSVHDPELPTVGPLRKRVARQVDQQIRQGVWTVCGVALSNSSVPPAMVIGCMAIQICREPRSQAGCELMGVEGGDRFTDRQEQDRLIQILLRTESLHGWPTNSSARHLCETWGYALNSDGKDDPGAQLGVQG